MMSTSLALWRSIAHLARHVSFYEFDHNIHISLRNNFLYVETPKVGCSTIKLTLARLELEDEHYDRDDLHNRNVSPLLRPSQVGDFTRFLKRAGLFKFCFVRNPYERLLSCYLNKVRGKDEKILFGLLLALGRDQADTSQEVGFEEFVSVIESMPLGYMDAHWRPQYFQTFHESLSFDFVGRLERFDQDLEEVGRRISPDFSTYYRAWTPHRTNAKDALREYYTPELQERVYSIYEIDFETFGYPKELPRASGSG